MGTEFQDPLAVFRGKAIETLFNQKIITIIIWILLIYIALLILRNILRGILFVVKTLLEIVTGALGLFPSRHKTFDPLQSDDWLTRAQAKQEIRFQNASPPLLPKKQPQKKKRKLPWQREEGRGWYSTGWTYNDETRLWEPPDYLK